MPKQFQDNNLSNHGYGAPACAMSWSQRRREIQRLYFAFLFSSKRLCDVFDDEVNKIAKNVGSRKEALKRIDADHSRVRFYLPIKAKRSRNSRYMECDPLAFEEYRRRTDSHNP